MVEAVHARAAALKPCLSPLALRPGQKQSRAPIEAGLEDRAAAGQSVQRCERGFNKVQSASAIAEHASDIEHASRDGTKKVENKCGKHQRRDHEPANS